MTRWNDGISLFINATPDDGIDYYDIWHDGGPGGPMLTAQSREAAEEICAAVGELLELRAEAKRLSAEERAAEVHLDLEAIKKRHLDPERNRGRTYYLGHIEVDLAACVEEIERLRDEVHELRLMVEEAARAENANAEDATKERAAVVEYLLAGTADCRDCMDAAVVRFAREIERGEHRREEER